MKIKILTLFLAAVLCFSFSGCGKNAEKEKESGKKIIAVSIVPEATFVEKVCGDNFEIVTMIPPGASPETYEPTPQEMQRLEQAEVYFSIGVPAEENSILPSVSADTEIISLHTMVGRSHKELKIGEERDPHIWLSPKRAMAMVAIIGEVLSEKDPQNKEKYAENVTNYISELEALDEKVRSIFGEKTGGKFIAFHPAFGYFADDYGLTMYALEEHGKEATAKRLADMADLAKKENIKTVFYQAENAGKQAEAFAEEIGGKAISLEPLAADYINNIRKMAKSISEAIKS